MAERTADGETVAPLVGTLPPQCQRDVDALRRFVHTTVSQESPAAPVSPRDFRDVLLTGATGFMGRFFLCDLLRQNADLVVQGHRILALGRRGTVEFPDFARIFDLSGTTIVPGFSVPL